MTKKVAIFVEGFTEQEFTIRLLQEIVGKKPIKFELYYQEFGYLKFVEIKTDTLEKPVIEVLVANCCNDAQVKSQINDQYKKLVNSGYTSIIGLRDVVPLSQDDIEELEAQLEKGLIVGKVPISMHLSVMETEAWFLEELTHYSKIDTNLGLDKVITNGFDYVNTRAYSLLRPADVLNKIYRSVNKSYKKKKNQIHRTVNAISYDELYENTRQQAPSLDSFIISLEAAIF